jgi:cyclopropane fatty-acyl-phospholipid synthase-like methyltransferase
MKIDNEITQFKKTYYSTIEFNKFLKKKFLTSKNILDLGCGKGGTLSYYVKKYPNTKFIGLDYRSQNIKKAKNLFKKFNLPQTEFIKINALKKYKNKKLFFPDGIISEKTFCTFKNIETPINNLIDLKPKWIGINSLFYKGNMDVLIHIRETKSFYSMNYRDNDPDGDYNIFSINNLEKILSKRKYKIKKIKPFFPPKSIKGNKNYRGTYTMKTSINSKTCFSGPVYLPWYFILIEKN